MCSWFSADIPALQKQFTIVSVVSAFHAETNIGIPCSSEIFGRVLFFSKLLIISPTTFVRYFTLRDLITPWSIACDKEVVFGGRKNNLIAFRFSICGCAWQLSITSAIFLPSDRNFRSNSRAHSSNKIPSIQLFF